MTRNLGQRGILRLGFFLFFAASASAQSYKAEMVNDPAPQELSAEVRGALSDSALRVSGPQVPICEIWLRKAIPASATPDQGLGIAFGQIADGTLVGAIRFPAASKDYRQQDIKAGVYTLRYALQPVNGNHQGTSPYRDFLLASPAAADTALATVTGNTLYNLSRRATGTGHPSVWCLLAADSAPATLPGVAHIEDGDLWVVYFKAPLQPAGGAASSVTIGLVVTGHAPEA